MDRNSDTAEVAEVRGHAGIARRDGYRFDPHVTLGRRKGVPFDEAVAAVAWDGGNFVPVHSHVGARRHDVPGRWRLGTAPLLPAVRYAAEPSGARA